jgi:hypothetical protein
LTKCESQSGGLYSQVATTLKRLNNSGAECKTAAEGAEAEAVAFLESREQLVEAERDAGRVGVAVAADVAEDVGADAALDGVDGPLVGLMRDDDVQVVNADAYPTCSSVSSVIGWCRMASQLISATQTFSSPEYRTVPSASTSSL